MTRCRKCQRWLAWNESICVRSLQPKRHWHVCEPCAADFEQWLEAHGL